MMEKQLDLNTIKEWNYDYLNNIKSQDQYYLNISRQDFKRYGVPRVERISSNQYLVTEVIEKPNKPISGLGILPLYYFRSEIFTSLLPTLHSS